MQKRVSNARHMIASGAPTPIPIFCGVLNTKDPGESTGSCIGEVVTELDGEISRSMFAILHGLVAGVIVA